MSRHNREIPEYVLDNLDNVKAEALSKGYTLKALGEKVGFARGFVQHLATGTFTPSRESYNRVACVLGWKEWE